MDYYISIDELECSICKDLFSNPYEVDCGHLFCRMCIQTAWKITEDCPPSHDNEIMEINRCPLRRKDAKVCGLKPSPFVARLLLNIKKYEDESINFKKKLEDQLKEQKREHNENQRMKEEVKDLQYRIIELMNENHRLKEGINEKNTQFQDLEDYMMESKIEKLKIKNLKDQIIPVDSLDSENYIYQQTTTALKFLESN